MSTGYNRGGTVEVDIARMAYAPVDGSSVRSVGGNTGVQSDETIPPVLSEHIEEIAIKRDTLKVTHGTYGDSENRTRDILDSLHSTTDDSVFLDHTVELANQLSDQMPGSATAGTLVVARASLSGDNITDQSADVVVLLKLDGERMERPTVSDEGMRQILEENVLPSRDRIQKGAVYPGEGVPPQRQNGDIKIYEQSDTEYFAFFLNCSGRIKSTYGQAQSAISVSNNLVESKFNRELDENDYSVIRSFSEDDGTINASTLSNALEEISEGEITQDEVTSALTTAGLSDLSTSADSIPNVARRELKSSRGTLVLKYPISASENVSVGEGSITVEFDDIEKSYVQK